MGIMLFSGLPVKVLVKIPPAITINIRDVDLTLGQKDPLVEGMVTHSSKLVWRSLWTEEPHVLQSIESQRMI